MVQPGDFIEFQGRLGRNPLIDVLQTFQAFLSIFAPGSEASGSKRRSKRCAKPESELGTDLTAARRQLEPLFEMLVDPSARDLVTETANLRVVVTVKNSYFVDPTMNDAIDGTFRVFGKVSRVVTEDGGEGINLLRKTPMAKLGDSLSTFAEVLQSLQEISWKGSLWKLKSRDRRCKSFQLRSSLEGIHDQNLQARRLPILA